MLRKLLAIYSGVGTKTEGSGFSRCLCYEWAKAQGS